MNIQFLLQAGHEGDVYRYAKEVTEVFEKNVPQSIVIKADAVALLSDGVRRLDKFELKGSYSVVKSEWLTPFKCSHFEHVKMIPVESEKTSGEKPVEQEKATAQQ